MTESQNQRMLGIYQQHLADEQLKTATLTVQLQDALAALEQLRPEKVDATTSSREGDPREG